MLEGMIRLPLQQQNHPYAAPGRIEQRMPKSEPR